MTVSSNSIELARTAPLVGSAIYLNFISQYGGAMVTTFALIYAIMQITLRWREHRALMRTHKEAATYGRKRRK